MYKSYKYRLYPTEAQKVLLGKHFGCSRLIYNLALEAKLLAYSGTRTNLTAFDLMYQLPGLKNEYPWLKEVSSTTLQSSISNLDKSFKNFYKGICEFPKFKNKSSNQSFKAITSLRLHNGKLIMPKFLEGIKIALSRVFDGKIITVTISKTNTNKYFASLDVLTNDLVPAKKSIINPVGVDLGIKTFAVMSDGKTIEAPNFLRVELKRLSILQRRASRKRKGSSNRKKANLRVALLHEKIANQRADFLHKSSNQITNDYDTICLENLNVSGMVRNHNLALSISDASWSEFVRQLKYKSEWRGNNIIQIGRFEPTSKACSNCGIVKPMPLTERVYVCDCGLSIDRDLNAAINIRNSGIGRAGVSVELPTVVGAVKQKLTKV